MTQPNPGEVGAVETRVDRYLQQSGLAARVTRIVPLTGDASDRRYIRILLNDGRSLVLAVHAGAIDFASLPFATVAELLQRMGLPVPAVLGHSDDEGIVAQSDLGDVTLQAHLGTTSAAEHSRLYREAVSLLVELQEKGRGFQSEGSLPYRMAFDVEKLTWELEFFVRHFLEAYRGASLTPEERDALGAEWRAIAEELAAEPRVLCHRDYHSRNLMVSGGHLHLIDFQDARLGPDTYDLASLLRDSYVDLPDQEVDELIAYFIDVKRLGPGTAEFRRRFDLMALQRNLKALGTFGYQTTTRGNPVYLQYVPRTLQYVRLNLAKYRRFAGLRARLGSWLEELR